MTIREMMAMYHSLQFVEELLDYIEQYPDDDYMTMECLCRKLVKYKLMKKIDGYYIEDLKTEPSAQEYEKWLFKEPSRAEQTEPSRGNFNKATLTIKNGVGIVEPIYTEPSYDKCDTCVNLGELECGMCTNYSGYAPRTKTEREGE